MGTIKFETKHYTFTINENGYAESLIHKESGEECLDKSDKIPLFCLTEPRPFNNELKLAHPTKRTTFYSDRISYEDGKLVIGFNLIKFTANVGVTVKDDYIAFELLGYNLKHEDFGNLRITPPPVESFRILALPVKSRKYFGEWLNLVSDERVCVGVISTSPYAIIDSECRGGYRILTADAIKSVKLNGTSAAIVVSSPDRILDCIEAIETDYDLPKGVKSRRSDLIAASIFWTDEICPENADKLISYAKEGGYKLMLINYGAIVREFELYSYCGDYDYNENYPNGDEDLKFVLNKIKAAGIKVGIHFLHTHIGKRSRYITPVCDRRINLTRHFTLSKPLSADDTTVFVDENPEGAVMHPDVRVLRFDGELIYYDGYTTEPPYRFIGCRRGYWSTNVTEHDLGTIGGILDISEYRAVSAYVNQNSDLQEEIADKIAHIYNLGFEFVYFDGSEGTNPPYDFHVANAQYRVYKKLSPAPLFCEGAAKSHFSWHMLSGGNAFDCFSDELFKAKLIEWPLREAAELRHDLTRVNFGWWAFRATTQPDYTEFGISRAASYSCPATYLVRLDEIDKCARRSDVLEVMRRWEYVREHNLLTEAQKCSLRDGTKEHIMLINEKSAYELREYEQLKEVANGNGDVRAFTFEREKKSYAVIWHTNGAGELFIPLDCSKFDYFNELNEAAMTKNEVTDGCVIPLSKRRYISTDLSLDELKAALVSAKVL